MKKNIFHHNKNIRFRRWNRKNYSVFAGLHRIISIGHVAKSICEKAILKTNPFSFTAIQLVEKLLEVNEKEQTDEDLSPFNVLIECVNPTVQSISVDCRKEFAVIHTSWKLMNGYHPTFSFLKKSKFGLVVLLFILSFFSSQAQTNDSVMELKPINVTAGRNKMYSNTDRILNVIEKPEIEKASLHSIDDLLKFVAGIDVRQRGTNGIQSDISIRGGSFDQVLVLLNGVNITDPQTGHYNLDIPVEISDVSRIEILQGSAARLLGPNAFSGAINIVTNGNPEKKLNSETTAGSYGFFAQNLSANFPTEKYRIFGSANFKRSDGYIDNTDFNTANGFFQYGLRTSNSGNFDFQMAYQQKTYGANSFYSLTYPNQFERTKTMLSALNWEMKKKIFTYQAQAYWRQHHDRFDLFRYQKEATPFSWYTGPNFHLTDICGGKITASVNWKGGKSTLGIDLRNEHIFSNVLGKSMTAKVAVPFEKNAFFTKEADRLLKTIYFDHDLTLEKWSASAGASITNSKEFGTNMNGGLDLAFSPAPNARIYVSANSANRLPTFTDLYYQSKIQQSNPNLQPEKSVTFEIGTKINPVQWTFTMDTYHRMGKNIIDWIKTTDSEIWKSENLTAVDATGLDVNLIHVFKNSFLQSVGISYSFLTLSKNAEGFDSKYALDYLKNKFVLTINHSVLPKLSIGWNLAFFDRNGNYTDFATQQLTNYQPYWLLNARIRWKTEKITLFADGNNLLNQQYLDFGGISQPKINFTAGIQLTIL